MKQKTIKWNTGSAARRFRALIKDSKKYNPSLTKKLKKLQAASSQAPSSQAQDVQAII